MSFKKYFLYKKFATSEIFVINSEDFVETTVLKVETGVEV